MNTKLLTQIGAFALLVVMLAIAGCTSQDSATRNMTTLPDSVPKPDTEVKGAKIDLFDKQEKTTEILARRILKFDAKDSTMGYEVNAHIFDSTGKVISNVVGDSALIRENSNHLYIYGHVVVISEDSTRLDTDFLHWNPTIKKIQTDSFVKIYRHGDVATGWGMEANETLTRVKILNQVSGTIQNIGTYEDSTSH
jgi:LPS export ABC transporter protein LptC